LYWKVSIDEYTFPKSKNLINHPIYILYLPPGLPLSPADK
jgi:hypothetical protein